MAPSFPLKCFFSLFVSLCVAASFCNSDDAVDVVARALACFNDRYVYSGCQDSYRLTAAGAINVPAAATDEYCGGPCLAETRLVLNCVNDILYNFRFYNGASVRDVRYTLAAGCGHTSRRGDFNVQKRWEGDPYGDYYYDYNHGNNVNIPIYLLLFFSFMARWA